MNTVALQLVEFTDAATGFALLSIGLLAILLWAVVKFKNPAGMIMWCISVLVLLSAGIYELGDDIFWLSCMMTTIVVTIGVAVRWTQ